MKKHAKPQYELPIKDERTTFTIRLSTTAAADLAALQPLFPLATRTSIVTHATAEGLRLLRQANAQEPKKPG